MNVKKVQDLSFEVNQDDHHKLLKSFSSDYNIKMGVIQGIKYTEHLQGEDNYILICNDVNTVVLLMIEAVKVVSLSVDKDSSVIERVHFIMDRDFNNILIHLEFKEDEISHLTIPRFIGSKYVNIDVLRRIATNLSGQYNFRIRVYI